MIEGLQEALDWVEGSSDRVMKHHVMFNGKRVVIEAKTKEEFKRKLKQLEEFDEDDGA